MWIYKWVTNPEGSMNLAKTDGWVSVDLIDSVVYKTWEAATKKATTTKKWVAGEEDTEPNMYEFSESLIKQLKQDGINIIPPPLP